MSRLDSVIRRLQAQRACLDRAVDLVRDLPGPVLELGLGNGVFLARHVNQAIASGDVYRYGITDLPQVLVAGTEQRQQCLRADNRNGCFNHQDPRHLSESGKLVIAPASPDGYKELSSGVILKAGTRCWTMPALSDGLIYARNAAGDIVCAKAGK